MTDKIDHPNHISKISFKLVTTTKGAIRYVEVDENGNERKDDATGAFIGTLYLRKKKLNGREPQALTMDLDDATTA